MEEFNGCKGAWIHHKPHGYQHSVGGWIQSEKGKICDVSGLEVGREAAFANANLIAAAPELLEELIETHSALCLTPDYPDSLRYHRNKAAIAKALGK